MTKLNSLKQAIDLAVEKNTKAGEYDAEFSIDVNGSTWDCYTASISYKDILLYCKQGTATFLVDSYGDKNTVELFDWCEE